MHFLFDVVQEFPVTTVELGVQSMDDDVLALATRGHTAADTRQAVNLLRESGYAVGCQLMVGLPGPTLEAADEKNREGSQIPLRADLVEDIRGWLEWACLILSCL